MRTRGMFNHRRLRHRGLYMPTGRRCGTMRNTVSRRSRLRGYWSIPRHSLPRHGRRGRRILLRRGRRSLSSQARSQSLVCRPDRQVLSRDHPETAPRMRTCSQHAQQFCRGALALQGPRADDLTGSDIWHAPQQGRSSTTHHLEPPNALIAPRQPARLATQPCAWHHAQA